MTIHERVLDSVIRACEIATHKLREMENTLKLVEEQRDEMRKLTEELSAYYYVGPEWMNRFNKLADDIDVIG